MSVLFSGASVVIGIKADDDNWHAQIPGTGRFSGPYDEVADFLDSCGIDPFSPFVVGYL